MTAAPVLALLQEAAPEPGVDLVVVGYALVATGAADLLVAIMMLLTERPADPGKRVVVVGAIGFSGLAMIVAGILLWMGILG